MRRKIAMKQMTVKQLDKKIQSHLRTAIRYGIGTGRLSEEYNLRLMPAVNYQREVNITVMIDTGKQCTIAGMGKVYDEFLRTGELKGFTGFGMVPAKYNDDHFAEAPIRIMSFAETFGNIHYDCTQNIVYIPEIDDKYFEDAAEKVDEQSEVTDEDIGGQSVAENVDAPVPDSAKSTKFTTKKAPKSKKVSQENKQSTGAKTAKGKVKKRKCQLVQSTDDSEGEFLPAVQRKKKVTKIGHKSAQKQIQKPRIATDVSKNSVHQSANNENSRRFENKVHNTLREVQNLAIAQVTDNPTDPHVTDHVAANGHCIRNTFGEPQNDLIAQAFNASSHTTPSSQESATDQNLSADVVNLESDLSSCSCQPSIDRLNISDLGNLTFDTLQSLASLSNQDQLIYGD